MWKLKKKLRKENIFMENKLSKNKRKISHNEISRLSQGILRVLHRRGFGSRNEKHSPMNTIFLGFETKKPRFYIVFA